MATSAAMVVVCGAVVLASATAASATEVTQIENRSATAVMGPNYSLYYSWQTIDTTPWHSESVAGTDSTYSAPSLAWVGDYIVIAVLGADDSLDVYWQKLFTTQWNSEQISGPGTAASAPSLADIYGDPVIAVASRDGSLHVYQAPSGWQDGTSSWSLEQVAGAGSLAPNIAKGYYMAPSLARVGLSAVIAATGSSYNLSFYWRPFDGTRWSAPEPVAGAGSSVATPSVAQVGNSSVIAAKGNYGSLGFYWQTIGTVPWHPEQVTGVVQQDPTWAITSGPSVAQVGNSTVIAALNQTFGLAFFYQPIDSTAPWTPEQVNDDYSDGDEDELYTGPSVAQVGDSSVIVSGDYGDENFYWQTIGTGPWNSELITP